MATASGTASYCGINPQYLFAHQRRGAYVCSDKSRHLPRVARAFDQDDAAELL